MKHSIMWKSCNLFTVSGHLSWFQFWAVAAWCCYDHSYMCFSVYIKKYFCGCGKAGSHLGTNLDFEDIAQ